MEILEVKAESVKIVDNQRQMWALMHVKTALESHNIIKYNLLRFLELGIPGVVSECLYFEKLGLTIERRCSK